MSLPPSTLKPPFQITRASHLVLTVRDLAASRAFYTEVIGLVVSAETEDTLYLRGIEETSHHSLVLKRTDGAPSCDRVGLRVFTDEDVEAAHQYFGAKALPSARVEVPYQGPTVQVSDPDGMRLEFCATMHREPRMLSDIQKHKGAAALRMDHYQVLVPDVDRAFPFYAGLGFRVADYIQDDVSGKVLAVFMYRKNNPHDLVLVRRSGPRFHHCGYIVQQLSDIFRACDIAGHMGYGHEVERGPGRHGLGHSIFVYIRDPDGHRIELLLPPIQMVDIDEAPNRWSATNGFAALAWGLPAPRRWYEQAAPYLGVTPGDPSQDAEPLSLERYLGVE